MGIVRGNFFHIVDDDASNSKVFRIDDLQILESINEGLVCQAWVRPMVDDHINDEQEHGSGHDVCDYPLAD